MTKQAPHESALANFSESSSKFRALINESRRHYNLMKRDNNRYSEICSGMDYIDDILLGFQGCLERDDSGTDGEHYYPYIEIIGILNCMQIQQNIIIRTHFLVTGEKIDLKKEYEAIKKIREVRNAVAAHPMIIKGESHVINRHFLSAWHFEYISYGKKNDYKPKRVDLYFLFCQHLKILCQVLEKIIGYMENEDDEHKKQFKDEKLADTLAMHRYFAGKLFDDSYSTRDIHAKYIGEKLDGFEAALLKRGGHFLKEGGISDDILMIRHALARCSSFTYLDNDARIYASFVSRDLKELEEVAQQIDADYSGQPLQEEKQVIVCMPSSNRLIIKNKKDRKT